MKKLFNLLLIISSIFILSACAESGDSKGATVSFDISDSGLTTTIGFHKNGTYNLKISGSDNTITIKENKIIKELKISGSKNTVYIERNTSVSNFKVSGIENVIYVPLNSKISFTDTRTGTEIGTGTRTETETGNKLKTQTTNSISSNTNSISSKWLYAHTDTGCNEEYTFTHKNNDNGVDNGIFSGTSKILGASEEKVFSGVYSFEETVVTGTKHTLKVIFFSDNNSLDCNGVSSDKTGKTEITYINFLNSKKMQWYSTSTSTSTSGTAIATFLKNKTNNHSN
jgi:hypothetical protein